MNATAERRLKNVPSRHQGLYRRVVCGEKVGSPKACIKLMCLECMGYETKYVSGCTSEACPLWRLRPTWGETPVGRKRNATKTQLDALRAARERAKTGFLAKPPVNNSPSAEGETCGN